MESGVKFEFETPARLVNMTEVSHCVPVGVVILYNIYFHARCEWDESYSSFIFSNILVQLALHILICVLLGLVPSSKKSVSDSALIERPFL